MPGRNAPNKSAAPFNLPWRADCYPQAIIARLVLGLYRLPWTVSMGVRRDPASGEMQAHAWVECGGLCVTGGNSNDSYSLVGVFASRDMEVS